VRIHPSRAAKRHDKTSLNGTNIGNPGQASFSREFGTFHLPKFEVLGFMAPLVVVRRRSDGARGSLYFQHDPRFYYGFEAD
jgi:hypothetical protein